MTLLSTWPARVIISDYCLNQKFSEDIDNYNENLTHHCLQLVSIRNLFHIEQEVKIFMKRHVNKWQIWWRKCKKNASISQSTYGKEQGTWFDIVIYNCNYLFNSRMAQMKNTKRKQSGPRYPLAEYQKLTGNKSIDSTNLYKMNNEFIRQLLHELIANIISPSEIEMHEKTISNTENQNVEPLDEDANKENELTVPMHDNDKSTNCEIWIQNILKEAQENRKVLVEDIQKPIIYSEMVASTGHPTQIKGGKPFSFNGSYYAKINNEKLKSMKRGKGIGKKKIKIN